MATTIEQFNTKQFDPWERVFDDDIDEQASRSCVAMRISRVLTDCEWTQFREWIADQRSLSR